MQEESGTNYFEEHAEWISDHISNHYLDEEVSVFHEIVSPDLHLDVFFIQSEKHSFNILLTSGMSSWKMDIPQNVENPEEVAFAELMILLPKELEFSEAVSEENTNGWIIAMLKQAARFPYQYETWLGVGHTIQANEKFEAYDISTKFAGLVILPSMTFDEDFTAIRKNEKLINIYTVFPMYKDEIEFKIENGYEGLVELLQKSNFTELFDSNRPSLIQKKSIWNRLFGG